MELDSITKLVIDSSIDLHKNLGPGLLESVYETVLGRKLERLGLRVEIQKPMDFIFDGISFHAAYRIDLLVERKVIVELKSVERTLPVHAKQVLTYLRLSGLEVGLLLNFGCETMKEGIHRIVNHYISPRLDTSK